MAMATSPSDGGTRRQRIERLIRRGDRLAEGDREHVAPPGDAVEPPLPTRRSSWTPQEDAKLRELVQRLGRRWSDVASHFPARDRKRCRERFVNHLAPSPSAAWSLEDDRKLLNLQQEVGPRWAELARRLGRTADSVKNRCLLLARRAEKRRRGEKKAPKTWTKPEREKLRALVATHGARNWLFIASQLPGRTDLQCLQQWYRTLDDTVTKGKGTWTQTEDRVLKEKVEEIGRKWTQVAAFLPGRIGSQCRERYLNCVEPSIAQQAPWTAAEEQILTEAVKKYSTQWGLIGDALPGRSENAIKNHWYSRERRRMLTAASVIEERMKVGEEREPPHAEASLLSGSTEGAD